MTSADGKIKSRKRTITKSPDRSPGPGWWRDPWSGRWVSPAEQVAGLGPDPALAEQAYRERVEAERREACRPLPEADVARLVATLAAHADQLRPALLALLLPDVLKAVTLLTAPGQKGGPRGRRAG